MGIAVRYHSRSGNTKKLAEAVAEAIGAEALEVSVPLAERADTLFLCASVYAGKFDAAVGEFLEQNGANIARIVLIGSSASGKSVYPKLKAVCDSKDIALETDVFTCPGHFLFMHKGRPDEKDLSAAGEFAKKHINP